MNLSFEDLISPFCRLCPRKCEVDRRAGQRGFCGAGYLPSVSQADAHHGEEPVLSGSHGSGTIFLTGCNLHCVFCQNEGISKEAGPKEESIEDLAGIALHLQKMGCHNINFVTPTHHADTLKKSITLARTKGLNIPIVYNCGGYESIETLSLLDGLVDIYMPDVKFFDPTCCQEYLNAPDYPQIVKAALKSMQDQVGDLKIENGLAVKGLLVRHLVMPGCVEDSLNILNFLSQEISSNLYMNVMGQYWPTQGVRPFPKINRGPEYDEVRLVMEKALKLGLRLCR